MTVIQIDQLMATSGVQFGTSGVRGLVKDMSDQVCWLYVTAFIQYLTQQQQCQRGDRIGIAGDLRDSTPRIMAAAVQAIRDQGCIPIVCGDIPSPAIALYGLTQAMPTMMVTGSHIPDDRNGIKFNKADGEILKPDELAIRQQTVELDESQFDAEGMFIEQQVLPESVDEARLAYIRRFTEFFPNGCFNGKRIGLYEHSSVSRDCLKIILEQLGADVVSLARSTQFVAVDTEAIRAEDIRLAKQWSDEHHFDCIISTDGDGDRPLISDEYGQWLRGDVAGILCARYLSAEAVVTPISSNSAVELSGDFAIVTRTKIGSPYVIEAMTSLLAQSDRVVGYEANGGFLQASPITINDRTLTPLPTRDAVIVPLTILMLSIDATCSISQLLADLPHRYTASDRLKDFPTVESQEILATMIDDKSAVATRFPFLGEPIDINTIDGVRMTFDNGDIVHLRPSGNAPELRCYTESASVEMAKQLNRDCIDAMSAW